MLDLKDGESVEVKGSGAKPYVLKNIGGVYSCSCPAWRNQSIAIERRTCKHLRKLRGDDAETIRIGSALPAKPAPADGDEESAEEPPILLAERWDNDVDLVGWWMSEKLDGVRAYWDGEQFLSRQGNLYHAPDWFVEQLPESPLDGELWLGRKAFQRTVSIARRQDKSEHWKELKFVIFDAPSLSETFENRLEFIREQLRERKPPYALALDHQQCRSADHLREELARIEALGGEGLMLRQPQSRYEVGRSTTLLKVKSFRDAEATVIGHEPGKGKHKGRLGAISVRLSNGIEFSVGTGFSDAQRAAPPPIGSLITFRYQELSDAGVPRFPSFVGIRNDAPPAAAMATIVSTPPATPSATIRPSVPARRFEFNEGTSNKFWEVSVSGSEMTTRWGRIGSAGQSKTKSFASAEAARAAADKLIAEKTKEGYRENAE
jgi:DNA ligase-1